jgi:hypothetical protein
MVVKVFIQTLLEPLFKEQAGVEGQAIFNHLVMSLEQVAQAAGEAVGILVQPLLELTVQP